MVGRLLRQTRFHVDVAAERPRRERLRGEDVIDPPPEPPFNRLRHPVIEEGVAARLSRVVFAEDVGEAARPDGGEGLPHLGGEADVAEKPLGVVDVDRLRGDVEVAAPDERGVPGGYREAKKFFSRSNQASL